MKKLNENLSELLDIHPIDLEEKPTTTEIVDVQSVDNSVEDDTNFARQNIRELIDKGSGAINELASVARDSQHPRAYEVMATLLKNLSDMNKDLLEIQKRKKDLMITQSNKNGDVNVDKAVFVGSTAELMKLIKTNKA